MYQQIHVEDERTMVAGVFYFDDDAALKKAKNATMYLALNVQWSSQSCAAMLSVNSAMMR